MATIKRSRQREAIKEYLAGTKSHPTADEVYENIRQIYPNVSLGTIYRNLNFLVEQGEIQKLSCEDNKEHYDGNARPHSHFYCRCCHKVSDLNTPMPVFHHLADEIGFQGTIEACVTFYMGVCPLCNAAK